MKQLENYSGIYSKEALRDLYKRVLHEYAQYELNTNSRYSIHSHMIATEQLIKAEAYLALPVVITSINTR